MPRFRASASRPVPMTRRSKLPKSGWTGIAIVWTMIGADAALCRASMSSVRRVNAAETRSPAPGAGVAKPVPAIVEHQQYGVRTCHGAAPNRDRWPAETPDRRVQASLRGRCDVWRRQSAVRIRNQIGGCIRQYAQPERNQRRQIGTACPQTIQCAVEAAGERRIGTMRGKRVKKLAASPGIGLNRPHSLAKVGRRGGEPPEIQRIKGRCRS